MRKLLVVLVLCFAVVLLTGCLAGPNASAKVADAEGDVAGFWKGLWHGILAPITFIISLFADGIHFYEVHNNGNWYDFGFVLGTGILFGGGSRAARKRK